MKNTQINVSLNKKIGEISPLIYGHFAEHIGGVIYDGIWVGKNSDIPNVDGYRLDVVEAFRKIKPSVIRWPGGCFAETYNWRDGIGKGRPVRTSWWTSQDGRYETNEFGLHEFIGFCRLVGAEPYISINTTSMTPLDARDLVDYCNSPCGTTTLAAQREKNGAAEPFNVKYFGIGNENWGGGGTMSAEQYAYEYRKYSAVVRNAARDAVLVAAGANFHSDEWSKIFLSYLTESYGTPVAIDAFSFHYYFGGKDDVNFSEDEWKETVDSALKTEDFLKRLSDIIDKSGLEKKPELYIDEWGAMYKNGVDAKNKNQLFRQQCSMRDAVVSALTLNLFNNYSATVKMANVAQISNCLTALFLTDGKNFLKTPVYHVFDMYKEHQGAAAVKVDSDDTELSVSASLSGEILTVTAANLSYYDEKNISLLIDGISQETADVTLLTAGGPCYINSFDEPDRITPKSEKLNLNKGITLPRASVVKITLKIGER